MIARIAACRANAGCDQPERLPDSLFEMPGFLSRTHHAIKPALLGQARQAPGLLCRGEFNTKTA
ncbi:hypothetical protein D3C71_1849840 [compost metagenome]